MQSRVVICVMVCLGIVASTAQAQSGFFDKLKQAVGGDYTVRGRVPTHDGQWLTCFNGNNTGYLGPRTLARPGDAQVDPATGNVKVTTAAIPSIVFTSGGIVTSNDCDSLAAQGLLVKDGTPVPASGARTRSDSGYNDRDNTGCITPGMTKTEIAKRSNEIIACQAMVLSERDANAFAERRAQKAASGTAAAPAATVPRDASIRLQQETAEKFKAIQRQAATPAVAPSQSAEDLAWDGGKLCGLKPAYMMKLKEDALGFVRYDRKKGSVVMSEMAGGARREVTLDANAFAQRVSFNAQAIGEGGDTCGRAFWNAEAFKAASAAMSGG